MSNYQDPDGRGAIGDPYPRCDICHAAAVPVELQAPCDCPPKLRECPECGAAECPVGCPNYSPDDLAADRHPGDLCPCLECAQERDDPVLVRHEAQPECQIAEAHPCASCRYLEAEDAREDFAAELVAEYVEALERQRQRASLARFGGRALTAWYVAPVTAWQATTRRATRWDGGRVAPLPYPVDPGTPIGWAFTSSAEYVAGQARGLQAASACAALEDGRREAFYLADMDRYGSPAWPILEAARVFLQLEPGNIWYSDTTGEDPDTCRECGSVH